MPASAIARFEPKGPLGRLDRLKDFPDSILETDQPVQHGHLYMDDGQHGFSAGVWECTPFTTTHLPYPVNEFMLILEGSVTIVEPGGRETTIHAGEVFALPKDLPCQWKQTGHVRKYYVIFDDASGRRLDDPARLRVVRPDPRGRLEDIAPPPAGVLLSPAPVQHAREWFLDATGQWTVGVWDTTAYRRKPIPSPCHELMHILEGSVTLTDGAGNPHSFAAGDTVFVPLGAVCGWECSGYVRKVYCTLRPMAETAGAQAVARQG